jgi:hypothetical protein
MGDQCPTWLPQNPAIPNIDRDPCAVKGPHDMFGHKAGLTNRYHVQRVHDPKGKHSECRYFVLDPQHDPLARIALKAYADAAERVTTGQYGRQPYRALVRDLRSWLRRLNQAASPR